MDDILKAQLERFAVGPARPPAPVSDLHRRSSGSTSYRMEPGPGSLHGGSMNPNRYPGAPNATPCPRPVVHGYNNPAAYLPAQLPMPGVAFAGSGSTGTHQSYPGFQASVSVVPVQDHFVPSGGSMFFAGGNIVSGYELSQQGAVGTVPTGAGGLQIMDPVEERRRLQAQRQQLKIKQSFQASRTKTVDADALLNRIAADFKDVPAEASARSQPGSGSRPSTPVSPSFLVPKSDGVQLGTSSPPTTRNTPAADPAEAKPLVPKTKVPDLNDMMMKFSDLSAQAQSTRGFSTSTATLQSAVTNPKRAATFTESPNARDWKSLSLDVSSAFSSAPAVSGDNSVAVTSPSSDLPPWCSADASTLPPVYHSVLALFRKQQHIDKATVFSLMDRSGLSKSTLAQIWTNTSRTAPDVLTRSELCAALALIGLAQTNFDVQHLTVDVLRRIPSPPVPHFITSPPAQPVQATFPMTPAPPVFGDFQEISLSAAVGSPLKCAEEDEFSDFVSVPAPPTPQPESPSFKLPGVSLSAAPVKRKMPELILPARAQSKPAQAVQEPAKVLVDQPSWGGWLREETSSLSFSADRNTDGFSVNTNADLPATKASVKESSVSRFGVSPVIFPITSGKAKATAVEYSAFPEPGIVDNGANFAADLKKRKSPDAAPASVSLTREVLPSDPVVDPYAALRELAPQGTITFEPSVDWNQAHGTSQQESTFADVGDLNWSADSVSELSFTGEMGFSAASPSSENQSLNSLDLGLQLSLDDSGAGGMKSAVSGPVVGTDGTTPSAASTDPVEVWSKILTVCASLLQEACTILNSVSSSKTLLTVMERGTQHISNLIEVYRLARKIYLAAKVTDTMDSTGIVSGIKDTEEAWADFVAFLSMGSLEPPHGLMDFSSAEFGEQKPPLASVCGVCLLDVDGRSKSKKAAMDGVKLEHDGRFYHATCANFWVNCVEDILPRLSYGNA